WQSHLHGRAVFVPKIEDLCSNHAVDASIGSRRVRAPARPRILERPESVGFKFLVGYSARATEILIIGPVPLFVPATADLRHSPDQGRPNPTFKQSSNFWSRVGDRRDRLPST